MIQALLAKAELGENVYITDVRDAFSLGGTKIVCMLEPAIGAMRQWELRLPQTEDPRELAFVQEYFYACIYNIISTFGGLRMALCLSPVDAFAQSICATLQDVFQVVLAKSGRSGYGKCLNVADRINAAFGQPPFAFHTGTHEADVRVEQPAAGAEALSAFHAASQKARSATLCGIDIGGTDIKVIGTRNGRITAVKEFDWNPSEMTKVEDVIDKVLLMTDLMAAVMSLPNTPQARNLRAEMLNKDASVDEMRGAIRLAADTFGPLLLFDGIGVCFPDVVLNDIIVGGETYKTRGIRAASNDYEEEFARLKKLPLLILERCRQDGAVHIANDGSLAAYTAAVEIAHSPDSGMVTDGVLAHTLGTEFGSGWIDESGAIPQIPLEIYNCIIDIGNYPARAYDVNDVRSVNNFNTGLSGTLQKYCSQSGAYRLAMRMFETCEPQRIDELFDRGFLSRRGGGVYVAAQPADMRKPMLEYLMRLASGGDAVSEQIFREIGEFLAVTFEETEFLLRQKTKLRVLLGRFVKHQRCSELMQEGVNRRLSTQFVSGDSDLAFTPLMKDLRDDPEHTIAQFGQAVGAA
ncbi:MAG: hypothetical protein ABIK64_01615, partial [Bacillota bacterium]